MNDVIIDAIYDVIKGEKILLLWVPGKAAEPMEAVVCENMQTQMLWSAIRRLRGYAL